MIPSLWVLLAGLLLLLPRCSGQPTEYPEGGQRWRRLRQKEQLDLSIPWAMALAAELRAGAEPLAALRAAGESRGAARSAATAALGGDAAAIFAEVYNRTPLIRAIEVAWELNGASGFALADIIDQLVAGEVAAQQARRLLVVETAGPKHSARVVALLPLLGLLLAFLVGTNPLAWLLGTRLGLITLAVGLLLNGIGAFWAGRITRKVLGLL